MPLPHPLIGDEKLGLWLEANFVHTQGGSELQNGSIMHSPIRNVGLEEIVETC